LQQLLFIMVQTRSQTKHVDTYPEINFDEASEAWMSNKIKLENGCYKYICGKITKTGKKCMRSGKCKLHDKNNIKI